MVIFPRRIAVEQLVISKASLVDHGTVRPCGQQSLNVSRKGSHIVFVRCMRALAAQQVIGYRIAPELGGVLDRQAPLVKQRSVTCRRPPGQCIARDCREARRNPHRPAWRT